MPSAAHTGGVKASPRLTLSASNGVCGASHGAKTAASTMITVAIIATTVVGDVMQLYHASLLWIRRQIEFDGDAAVETRPVMA